MLPVVTVAVAGVLAGVLAGVVVGVVVVLVVGDVVGLVVGLVVGDVVGLVVGDVVRVGVDVAVWAVVDGCVTGVDAADVEGAAVVWVGVSVGDGELVVGVAAALVVLPASNWVAPAPPFPPPGLCEASRIATTATITTAAATGRSQRHRRPPDGGLRGGSGGRLGPPPGPMRSGPETGTRDVSGRTCSTRVAELAGAAPGAPTDGARLVGS